MDINATLYIANTRVQ